MLQCDWSLRMQTGVITGEAIRQAALHTYGAAGPSGVDAYAWHCFCSSFQGASTDLCNALQRLPSDYV